MSAEVQAPDLQVPRKIIRKYLDILSSKKALIIIMMMILMFVISKHVSRKDVPAGKPSLKQQRSMS